MNSRLITKDRRYLLRDERPQLIDVVRSEGDFLYDAKGRKYVDFLMGWCVGNLGWGKKELRRAIRTFNGPDYVLPSQLYAPWAELAELLAEITPGKLQKSVRATGGTEAVEIALQAAMAHTKRHGFISIEGAYHGHSIGAMSVGSSRYRGWYKNLLPNCYKIKPPLDDAAAEKVIAILKSRKIAAFIAEPIIMNLGVTIPTQSFWRKVQRACRQYGTLLIIDEVATGFGRTGKMFGANHYGLTPDIMTLGKGISSGVGALGATIMTPAVAKSFSFDFSYYSTYGWHPLNVAAAIVNIRYLKKHERSLMAHANAMGEYFEQRLLHIPFHYPVEIRRRGMAIKVRFQQKGYGIKVATKAAKNGVIVSHWSSDGFNVFPSLTITKKVAAEGLRRIAASV